MILVSASVVSVLFSDGQSDGQGHKERNLTIFLKEVAGRFFENLDFGYYHGSVMKCIRVKLIC